MSTVRRVLLSVVALAVVALTWMSAGVSGQGRPGSGDWSTYGGDLASRRYRPFDQINRDNFNELEIAWRFKTDALGAAARSSTSRSTPLMVNGVLYTPAGTRRAVVALDAATGEMLWMHREDEGKRGEAAPRRLSGRGLAYWTDGKQERIVYVTPGYQMIALDAKTGQRVPGFGKNGVVDLKLENDQTDRSRRPARSACMRRRSSPRTSSSSAPRICRAARRRARSTRRATSADTTRAPASGCGSSTPFRSAASSATRRGNRDPGSTRATSASGRR